MIDLKNSFASTLTYLPQHFEPENPEYLQRVFQIMVNFFYAVGAIGFLVLVYLVLRFCCKKCVGPVKMSQITRSYRNTTWIILSNHEFYLNNFSQFYSWYCDYFQCCSEFLI